MWVMTRGEREGGEQGRGEPEGEHDHAVATAVTAKGRVAEAPVVGRPAAGVWDRGRAKSLPAPARRPPRHGKLGRNDGDTDPHPAPPRCEESEGTLGAGPGG